MGKRFLVDVVQNWVLMTVDLVNKIQCARKLQFSVIGVHGPFLCAQLVAFSCLTHMLMDCILTGKKFCLQPIIVSFCNNCVSEIPQKH